MDSKKNLKMFPWMSDINSLVYKSAFSENSCLHEEIFQRLYHEVSTEISSILEAEDFKRAQKLLKVLNAYIFFFHMSNITVYKEWKVPKSSFIMLVSCLIDLHIFLSHGDVSSPHLENCVKDMVLFIGSHPYSLWDVLLFCKLLKRKYSRVVLPIINRVMQPLPVAIPEPRQYMKMIVLMRYWKIFCDSRADKYEVLSSASKVRAPQDFFWWLSTVNIRNMPELPELEGEEIAKHFLCRAFPRGFFKKMREWLNKGITDPSPVPALSVEKEQLTSCEDSEEGSFFIDTSELNFEENTFKEPVFSESEAENSKKKGSKASRVENFRNISSKIPSEGFFVSSSGLDSVEESQFKELETSNIAAKKNKKCKKKQKQIEHEGISNKLSAKKLSAEGKTDMSDDTEDAIDQMHCAVGKNEATAHNKCSELKSQESLSIGKTLKANKLRNKKSKKNSKSLENQFEVETVIERCSRNKVSLDSSINKGVDFDEKSDAGLSAETVKRPKRKKVTKEFNIFENENKVNEGKVLGSSVFPSEPCSSGTSKLIKKERKSPAKDVVGPEDTSCGVTSVVCIVHEKEDIETASESKNHANNFVPEEDSRILERVSSDISSKKKRKHSSHVYTEKSDPRLRLQAEGNVDASSVSEGNEMEKDKPRMFLERNCSQLASLRGKERERRLKNKHVVTVSEASDVAELAPKKKKRVDECDTQISNLINNSDSCQKKKSPVKGSVLPTLPEENRHTFVTEGSEMEEDTLGASLECNISQLSSPGDKGKKRRLKKKQHVIAISETSDVAELTSKKRLDEYDTHISSLVNNESCQKRKSPVKGSFPPPPEGNIETFVTERSEMEGTLGASLECNISQLASPGDKQKKRRLKKKKHVAISETSDVVELTSKKRLDEYDTQISGLVNNESCQKRKSPVKGSFPPPPPGGNIETFVTEGSEMEEDTLGASLECNISQLSSPGDKGKKRRLKKKKQHVIAIFETSDVVELTSKKRLDEYDTQISGLVNNESCQKRKSPVKGSFPPPPQGNIETFVTEGSEMEEDTHGTSLECNISQLAPCDKGKKRRLKKKHVAVSEASDVAEVTPKKKLDECGSQVFNHDNELCEKNKSPLTDVTKGLQSTDLEVSPSVQMSAKKKVKSNVIRCEEDYEASRPSSLGHYTFEGKNISASKEKTLESSLKNCDDPLGAGSLVSNSLTERNQETRKSKIKGSVHDEFDSSGTVEVEIEHDSFVSELSLTDASCDEDKNSWKEKKFSGESSRIINAKENSERKEKNKNDSLFDGRSVSSDHVQNTDLENESHLPCSTETSDVGLTVLDAEYKETKNDSLFDPSIQSEEENKLPPVTRELSSDDEEGPVAFNEKSKVLSSDSSGSKYSASVKNLAEEESKKCASHGGGSSDGTGISNDESLNTVHREGDSSSQHDESFHTSHPCVTEENEGKISDDEKKILNDSLLATDRFDQREQSEQEEIGQCGSHTDNKTCVVSSSVNSICDATDSSDASDDDFHERSVLHKLTGPTKKKIEIVNESESSDSSFEGETLGEKPSNFPGATHVSPNKSILSFKGRSPRSQFSVLTTDIELVELNNRRDDGKKKDSSDNRPILRVSDSASTPLKSPKMASHSLSVIHSNTEDSSSLQKTPAKAILPALEPKAGEKLFTDSSSDSEFDIPLFSRVRREIECSGGKSKILNKSANQKSWCVSSENKESPAKDIMLFLDPSSGDESTGLTQVSPKTPISSDSFVNQHAGEVKSCEDVKDSCSIVSDSNKDNVANISDIDLPELLKNEESLVPALHGISVTNIQSHCDTIASLIAEVSGSQTVRNESLLVTEDSNCNAENSRPSEIIKTPTKIALDCNSKDKSFEMPVCGVQIPPMEKHFQKSETTESTSKISIRCSPNDHVISEQQTPQSDKNFISQTSPHGISQDKLTFPGSVPLNSLNSSSSVCANDRNNSLFNDLTKGTKSPELTSQPEMSVRRLSDSNSHKDFGSIDASDDDSDSNYGSDDKEVVKCNSVRKSLSVAEISENAVSVQSTGTKGKPSSQVANQNKNVLSPSDTVLSPTNLHHSLSKMSPCAKVDHNLTGDKTCALTPVKSPVPCEKNSSTPWSKHKDESLSLSLVPEASSWRKSVDESDDSPAENEENVDESDDSPAENEENKNSSTPWSKNKDESSSLSLVPEASSLCKSVDESDDSPAENEENIDESDDSPAENEENMKKNSSTPWSKHKESLSLSLVPEASSRRKSVDESNDSPAKNEENIDESDDSPAENEENMKKNSTPWSKHKDESLSLSLVPQASSRRKSVHESDDSPAENEENMKKNSSTPWSKHKDESWSLSLVPEASSLCKSVDESDDSPAENEENIDESDDSPAENEENMKKNSSTPWSKHKESLSLSLVPEASSRRKSVDESNDSPAKNEENIDESDDSPAENEENMKKNSSMPWSKHKDESLSLTLVPRTSSRPKSVDESDDSFPEKKNDESDDDLSAVKKNSDESDDLSAVKKNSDESDDLSAVKKNSDESDDDLSAEKKNSDESDDDLSAEKRENISLEISGKRSCVQSSLQRSSQIKHRFLHSPGEKNLSAKDQRHSPTLETSPHQSSKVSEKYSNSTPLRHSSRIKQKQFTCFPGVKLSATKTKSPPVVHFSESSSMMDIRNHLDFSDLKTSPRSSSVRKKESSLNLKIEESGTIKDISSSNGVKSVKSSPDVEMDLPSSWKSRLRTPAKVERERSPASSAGSTNVPETLHDHSSNGDEPESPAWKKAARSGLFPAEPKQYSRKKRYSSTENSTSVIGQSLSQLCLTIPCSSVIQRLPAKSSPTRTPKRTSRADNVPKSTMKSSDTVSGTDDDPVPSATKSPRRNRDFVKKFPFNDISSSCSKVRTRRSSIFEVAEKGKEELVTSSCSKMRTRKDSAVEISEKDKEGYNLRSRKSFLRPSKLDV